jgi:tetraacyldisaccharide 4'-kinase
MDMLFRHEERWWKGIFLFPFLICSKIYGVIIRVRQTLYQRGIFKTRELPCKVISVGNITLGGTGKTPLVAALAKELDKHGLKVGILSRGYKGAKEGRGGVVSDGERIYLTPREAGDEPFMLALMLSSIPIVVGKKRYEMGVDVCKRFGMDVLILDDGFQHLRIKRDMDIVLIDARTGFSNGHLFPRGPLREPLGGLRRASHIILTKADSAAHRRDIEGVLRSHAPAIPLYHSRYRPSFLCEASSRKLYPPHIVRGKKVFAFAGIADPGYFVELLKGLGADVVHEIYFPDHYRYELKDVKMMLDYTGSVEVFVTTEKDFVKLQRLPLDNMLLYILGIEQEIMEEQFYQKVLSTVSS